MSLSKIAAAALAVSSALIFAAPSNAYELTINNDRQSCTFSALTTEDKLAQLWGTLEFKSKEITETHRGQNSNLSRAYNQKMANLVEAARLGAIDPARDHDAIIKYLEQTTTAYLDEVDGAITNGKEYEYYATKLIVKDYFPFDLALSISPNKAAVTQYLSSVDNGSTVVRPYESIRYTFARYDGSIMHGQHQSSSNLRATAYGFQQCYAKLRTSNAWLPYLAKNLSIEGDVHNRLTEKAVKVFQDFLQTTGTTPNADDAVFAITGQHLQQAQPTTDEFRKDPIGTINKSISATSSHYGSS